MEHVKRLQRKTKSILRTTDSTAQRFDDIDTLKANARRCRALGVLFSG
jgi:hypothetical protein